MSPASYSAINFLGLLMISAGIWRLYDWPQASIAAGAVILLINLINLIIISKSR